MLYSFAPAQHRFYPVCPIHHFTGLLCPGCGATRAMAALLHGRFADAMQLNMLFVTVMLPCGLFYLALALGRGRWARVPLPAVWAFGAAEAVFTIARNLHQG